MPSPTRAPINPPPTTPAAAPSAVAAVPEIPRDKARGPAISSGDNPVIVIAPTPTSNAPTPPIIPPVIAPLSAPFATCPFLFDDSSTKTDISFGL